MHSLSTPNDNIDYCQVVYLNLDTFEKELLYQILDENLHIRTYLELEMGVFDLRLLACQAQ